jgi:hypothetical protein
VQPDHLVSCSINNVAFVRQLPMRVDLRGLAAGSAHAPPLAEGSRIKMDPSLDGEEELLRCGPKRVKSCGSLCVWNDLETFSTPAC